MGEERHLETLARAKSGDQRAMTDICVYISKRYDYRLNGLYSSDPILSREDIKGEFMEGVFRGIEKVDLQIGNPLFHLAQRGFWHVMSAIQSARNRYRPSESTDAVDVVDHVLDINADDPADIVVRRHFSRHVVSVLATSGLEGNLHRAFGLILNGDVGDPTEPGFNKRLAALLSVSPQRASQITAQLQSTFWREEAAQS